MANMLYNGVELPEHPVLENCPYVVLMSNNILTERASDYGFDSDVALWDYVCFEYSSIPFLYGYHKMAYGAEFYDVYIRGPAWHRRAFFRSSLTEAGKAFIESVGYTAEEITEMFSLNQWTIYDGQSLSTNAFWYFGNHGEGTAIWSNTDIYYDDSDSVYLAASEPVDPNATSHITTSSGDGFALYNGVKLPAAPPTPVGYSGAFMTEFWGNDVCCFINFEMFGAIDDEGYSFLYAKTAGHAYRYILDSGTWVLFDEVDYAVDDVLLTWSDEPPYYLSENVYLGDTNTLFLAASDPIPLDGMTVIEWDGDTEGLEVFSGVWFKVAPFSDANAALAVYNNTTSSEFERGTENNKTTWAVMPNGVGLSYALAANEVYMGDFGDSLDGIYALAVDGAYTTLLAYKADSGGSTYDRTAFLSGMAMGLCGKGYPAGANGHMSYNGIELADINSIWTDKSNHVFICKAVNSYFAIVSTVAPYQDSVNGGISLSAPFYFKQYGCFTDEATANEYGTTAYTWTLYQEHSLDEGVSNFDQTVIWTSTDIRKDSDGSIFLAASEPIPAGGIGGNDDFTKGYLVGAELRRKRVIPEVKETATMLYNGVELMNLTELTRQLEELAAADGMDLDMTYYPYVYLTAITNDSGEVKYGFWFFSAALTISDKVEEEGVLCTPEVADYLLVGVTTDKFEPADMGTMGAGGLAFMVLPNCEVPAYFLVLGGHLAWSNIDVLHNGSVAFAASDPVPVT